MGHHQEKQRANDTRESKKFGSHLSTFFHLFSIDKVKGDYSDVIARRLSQDQPNRDPSVINQPSKIGKALRLAKLPV
jgi:hypothetical protein